MVGRCTADRFDPIEQEVYYCELPEGHDGNHQDGPIVWTPKAPFVSVDLDDEGWNLPW